MDCPFLAAILQQPKNIKIMSFLSLGSKVNSYGHKLKLNQFMAQIIFPHDTVNLLCVYSTECTISCVDAPTEVVKAMHALCEWSQFIFMVTDSPW